MHQIEQNVGIPEFNQNHDNKSSATTNAVTRNVQTINQDAENVSETTSVKRWVEERMKEFEIEFETKLQIERAQFDRVIGDRNANERTRDATSASGKGARPRAPIAKNSIGER